ncbi:HoxN/HupN/NixA family nickel/cobalt transporter [Methylocystis bryophila]|uniref:Nickel/cobalt efflux system n=1 Tax=Methylocystis bryophila TaxID=655015 RepID=A0A1W6MWA7_9HYPH|nr:HoxN/HupN/NixA family nickel/cobalt transporter [Methylocystis bryophila]ARN81890.1 nickel transporter [Methylocystis bryophila]BDV37973.1 nickel/cobalt efflux system [Methylocystis bryophila]
MNSSWSSLFNDENRALRAKVAGVYAVLLAANVAAWIWAAASSREFPMMLGMAALAYSLGLRHAFDADHIAAIDNVTRKLMQQGKRPIGVGLFFSLGHSTIVVGLTIAIAITATALHGEFESFKTIGGVIGSLVSSLFLLTIAFANALVLRSLYETFRLVRKGGRFVEEDLDLALSNQGGMGRLFRGAFRVIEQSWQMYPLGLLFGLGFDTATEVGLLGISATQASQGLSVWQILVFPALFTAGITLLDTTDNLLMIGAYGWASVKPIRKLYYNLTITTVSVLVALIIGGVEMLNLIGDRLGLTQGNGFWGLIGALNDNFDVLGAAIVGVFALSWVISYGVYKAKGYDEMGAVAE